MSAPQLRPSPVQRVALSVLAEGGFIDPGVPEHTGPRLYEADGRLFGLLARSTLDILVERVHVAAVHGPGRRLRYVATSRGREMVRRFRP